MVLSRIKVPLAALTIAIAAGLLVGPSLVKADTPQCEQDAQQVQADRAQKDSDTQAKDSAENELSMAQANLSACQDTPGADCTSQLAAVSNAQKNVEAYENLIVEDSAAIQLDLEAMSSDGCSGAD